MSQPITLDVLSINTESNNPGHSAVHFARHNWTRDRMYEIAWCKANCCLLQQVVGADEERHCVRLPSVCLIDAGGFKSSSSSSAANMQ